MPDRGAQWARRCLLLGVCRKCPWLRDGLREALGVQVLAHRGGAGAAPPNPPPTLSRPVMPSSPGPPTTRLPQTGQAQSPRHLSPPPPLLLSPAISQAYKLHPKMLLPQQFHSPPPLPRPQSSAPPSLLSTALRPGA